MDFYINRNSMLPVLKLELIDDGRTDFHKFFDKIQNSTMTFTMTNIENGMVKVAKQPANFFFNTDTTEYCEEYWIGYIWGSRDTNRVGTYQAQFEITFEDGSGNLIVPIKEELYIHVMDGLIKTKQ